VSGGAQPAFLAPGFELGGKIALPPFDQGFENPAAGMYASSEDIAQFIQFMFREFSIDDILDGTTKRKWLDPVFLGGLDSSTQTLFASGIPWEMHFPLSSDKYNTYWRRGKDGAIPGKSQIRNQILLIKSQRLHEPAGHDPGDQTRGVCESERWH
jgi:hypothetical protein